MRISDWTSDVCSSDLVEVQQVIKPGDTVAVGPVSYRFTGVSPVKGPNYTALQGRFEVIRNGEVTEVMAPAQRRYQQPPMETTEAAIHPSPAADLYAVQIGRATSELQSLMRISYAVFCLKQKKTTLY